MNRSRDDAPSSLAAPEDLSRRGFLKLGLAGTVMFSTATFLSGCGRTAQTPAAGYRFLRAGDVELFSALVPAVTDGMLPADSAARAAQIAATVRRVDIACLHLVPPAQAELIKLLDLLGMRGTRWLSTGVGARWSAASVEDVSAFFERWRLSSLAMFNAGYHALNTLVVTSYFGLAEAWPAAGYPGPLEWVYKAVNAPESTGGH